MALSTLIPADAQLDRQWWRAEDGKEHEKLFPLVNRLRTQDSGRRERVLKHIRMYGGLGPSVGSNYGRPDKLRYNVCKQAVNTLLAEISRSKPKATFLTQGGNWGQRQTAKQLELLTEAQMRDAGVYSGLARRVERDAEVTGVGAGRVYIDWATLTPKIDRVMWNELLVDEADGRYGAPRCLYYQHLMDRGVAYAVYGDTPERREAIRNTPRFSAAVDTEQWMLSNYELNESDLILIVEAWHLPSSADAKDGKHVTAIESCTLDTEAHTRERYPIIILRDGEEMVGFWGQGQVADIEPDQVELNRTLRRIQEAAGVAAGVWLLERAAKVRARHLTDVPGAAVEYTGAAPVYYKPDTVVADLVNYADGIISRVLQRKGISEMFASAVKPAGLDSGEAIRVHADVFSTRQIEKVQAYETWHVDVARAFVDANEDIAAWLRGQGDKAKKGFPEVSVSVKRGRRTVLKRIRFDKAELPENQWVIQPYPMSSLPSEPSGRQNTITDWFKSGIIDQTTMKSLLQIPDTESAMDLQLADYDFALWAVDCMLEDGEYVSPEPYQKLPLALDLVRCSYLRAVIDGAPDERLDLLRDHMDAIKRLIQKAMPPAPPALVAPGADASIDPAVAAQAAAPAPVSAGPSLQVAA
jgi:hypothetical protein